MINRRLGKSNNDKGFTLVELIVVLVLMMILLTIGVAGILTWQDFSRFKKENTAAETIFYAAQNQLTELSASGAYDEKINAVVDKNGFMIASPDSHELFAGNVDSISYEENKYYKWDNSESGEGLAIWANTPDGITDPEEREKYQGRIVVLSANADDYNDKYMNSAYTMLSGEEGMYLLFDLITPYISDKSILNGAIRLEFSPEAGQVFSVCYSDRATGFIASATADDANGIINTIDRTENTRRDKLVGYYAANSLSRPLYGRATGSGGVVELRNGNALELVIKDRVKTDYDYFITMFPASEDGQTLYKDDELATFSISFDGNTNFWDNGRPVLATADFYDGIYGESTEHQTVYFPVWILKNQQPPNQEHSDYTNEIHIVFDAADAQAQSYLSLASDPENDDTKAFLNTYSFYRFGFDMSSDELRKIAFNVRTSEDLEGSDSGAQNPVFADVAHNGNQLEYQIANGRHFYNVRFETDHKTTTVERVFRLTYNIDWKYFTGVNQTGVGVFLNDGRNWFLNSKKGALVANNEKVGIDFDGLTQDINRSSSISANPYDTAAYAFPGFLALGKGDTFTGANTENNAEVIHTISNLTIAFVSNLRYGVYGKEAMEKWCSSPVENYGKYNEVRYKAGEEMHPSHIDAMKGLYPLGLFAENSGRIIKLNLNAHKVIGMEKMGETLVYTNMVGGFAGDNLGEVKNLTLRDVDPLSLPAGNTRELEQGKTNGTWINGKTDVGGIIGRESWTVLSNKDAELDGLENYGTVTGMENVGGIVGRAYVIRDVLDPAYNTDSNVAMAYDQRFLYYDDGYEIFGQYVGGKLNVPGKSFAGRDVARLEKITIMNCTSHGAVSGDPLIYDGNIVELYETIRVKFPNQYGIEPLPSADLSNHSLRCANIGGIAGITMDGFYVDYNSIKLSPTQTTNVRWYEQQFVNNGHTRQVVVDNCHAYRLYSDADLASIVSKTGTIQQNDITKELQHDFYKGGLIGYARLTDVKNCDNLVDSAEPTGYHAFVFGRNYVGGIIGCFDYSMLSGEKHGNEQGNNERYYVTNTTNVIGVNFVGGFTGGAGLGSSQQENFSFKHPATNEGSLVSSLSADHPSILKLSNVENKGVVLAVKMEKLDPAFSSNSGVLYRQEMDIQNYKGMSTNFDYQYRIDNSVPNTYAGGIVGTSRYMLENLDNIQSDATKRYALEIIGFGNVSPESITKESLENVRSISYYGGVGVGGIEGIPSDGSTFNEGNAAAYSEVNAVVYGELAVGGVIGGPNGKNCYNSKIVNSLILGRDMVGGIVGKSSVGVQINDGTGQNKNNYTSTNSKVIGRYAVGGIAGYSRGGNFSTVLGTQKNPGEFDILVLGRAYVGGAVGLINNYNPTIGSTRGEINSVAVDGDVFVGGVVGGVYKAAKNRDNISCDNMQISCKNESVTAKMFAGGHTGLYAHSYRSTSGDVNSLNGTALSRLWEMADGCISALYTSQIPEGQDSAKYPYNKCLETVVAHQNDPSLALYYDSGTLNSELKISGENLTNQNVIAYAFAGGLIGYIPSNTNMIINCGTTEDNQQNKRITANVTATGTVSSNPLDSMVRTNDWFSYSAGIIGRIPENATVKNASFVGSLNTQSCYLGQIAEINRGTVGTVKDGKVEPCWVNSFTPANDVNTYIGGLVGLNAPGATVGENRFVSGAAIYGTTVLGGYIGLNEANLSFDGKSIYNGSAVLSIKDNAPAGTKAIGMIIGENQPTTYEGENENGIIDIGATFDGNTTLAQFTNVNHADYIGVYVGINKGRIRCNRNASSMDYSTNVQLWARNAGVIGLIAGRNEGTIQNIKINSDGKIKGFADGNVAYAGGIAGDNFGRIEYCHFTGSIGKDNEENTSVGILVAAGIAGRAGIKKNDDNTTYTGSAINACSNSGEISADANAGGILGGVNVPDGYIPVQGLGHNTLAAISNCVNTGNLKGLVNAGIAVTTGCEMNNGTETKEYGFGVFDTCRNYGSGENTTYEITVGKAYKIVKCLGAGGSEYFAAGTEDGFSDNYIYLGETVPVNSSSLGTPIQMQTPNSVPSTASSIPSSLNIPQRSLNSQKQGAIVPKSQGTGDFGKQGTNTLQNPETEDPELQGTDIRQNQEMENIESQEGNIEQEQSSEDPEEHRSNNDQEQEAEDSEIQEDNSLQEQGMEDPENQRENVLQEQGTQESEILETREPEILETQGTAASNNSGAGSGEDIPTPRKLYLRVKENEEYWLAYDENDVPVDKLLISDSDVINKLKNYTSLSASEKYSVFDPIFMNLDGIKQQ